MTEVRVAHALAPAEVLARLESLAAEQDVALDKTDAKHGSLTKPTPFGPVGGTFTIEPDALVVHVTARPPFLPEATVRRLLEENLRELLAG